MKFNLTAVLFLIAGCASTAQSISRHPSSTAADFQPLTDNNIQLLVTPSAAGHEPFIDAIQNARSSLEMMMYHLTDKNVINALTDAAKRGVDVEIILDGSSLQGSKLKIFNSMKKFGVKAYKSSKSFSITHAKSMVLDHELAFITAMNMTTEFSTTRDFGITTTDHSVIAEMENVFSADIKNSEDQTGETPPPSESSLVWSPVNSEARLAAVITAAHATIIATAENLGDKTIQSALIGAAKKGVKVRVIAPLCDENPNAHYNVPFINALSEGGVQAQVMPPPATAQTPYMHSKMILVDGKYAYVGSVNFSTNSMTKARELGVIFSNAPALSSIEKIFEQDWNVSEKVPGTLPACPSQY